MKTIPDSNILFDIVQRDPKWFDWTFDKSEASREIGSLVVNAIVYAEVAGHFMVQNELQNLLVQIGVELEEIPWEAAYLAG